MTCIEFGKVYCFRDGSVPVQKAGHLHIVPPDCPVLCRDQIMPGKDSNRAIFAAHLYRFKRMPDQMSGFFLLISPKTRDQVSPAFNKPPPLVDSEDKKHCGSMGFFHASFSAKTYVHCGYMSFCICDVSVPKEIVKFFQQELTDYFWTYMADDGEEEEHQSMMLQESMVPPDPSDFTSDNNVPSDTECTP